MNSAPRVVREASLDWVRFDAGVARDGTISPTAKALYAALASYANLGTHQTDERLDAFEIPTRSALAACVGCSTKTIDRATEELEKIELIKVDRRRDPSNPKVNLPNVYYLLDYQRWDARAAERDARRRANQGGKTAGEEVETSAHHPPPGTFPSSRGVGTPAHHPRDTSAPGVGTPVSPLPLSEDSGEGTEETHTPPASESALPRGECELRPVSEAADELLRLFRSEEGSGSEEAHKGSSKESISLPGGGAIVQGEVLSWSSQWSEDDGPWEDHTW